MKTRVKTVYKPVTDKLSLREVNKKQFFNKFMLFLWRLFTGVMYKSMTIQSVASVLISTKHLEIKNKSLFFLLFFK